MLMKRIIMSPHQKGGGRIVFGADPVGVGVSLALDNYVPHRRGVGHIVFWCGSCWRRRLALA